MQASQWHVSTPYFVAIAIDAIGFTIIAPVLVPLTNQIIHGHGLSQNLLYGFILAIYSLSFMLGAPILGALSDLLGRRKVLIIASSGVVFGYICYILTIPLSSLGLLILGRIITGFCAASQCIAQAAMVDISQAKHKAINIGLIAAAMTAGLVLGPLASIFLKSGSNLSGLSTAFYIIIAVLILNLTYLLFFLKDTYSVKTPEKEVKLLKKQFFYFIEQFKNKNTSILLITFFLFELGWSLYYQSLAIELPSLLDLKPKTLGLFLSFIGLSLTIALIGLVRLSTRYFNLKISLKFSFKLGITALMAQFFLTGLFWHFLLGILITSAVALGYTGLISLLSLQTDKAKQGLLMGTTDSLLALAFTITGLLGGFLAYFLPGSPVLISAIFWFLAMVFCFNLETAVGRDFLV